MKTEHEIMSHEIMSAPAEEVAKVLAAFNVWRRKFSNCSLPCTAIELGFYIDRAVELLNQKGVIDDQSN